MKMSDSAPMSSPLFSRSLTDCAIAGVSRSYLQRTRALLLAGRAIDDMAATSHRVHSRLVAAGPLVESRVDSAKTTAGDGATKLLIRLADGNAIETVVLPSPRGVSVCVSSQVGCPVGCRFCASGVGGLVRNLETHEIVEQIVHARRVNPRVDRLVVMGIGEPMLNAERLFLALEILREEGSIGPRHMIVSTVGANGAIRRLGAWGRKVTLALSLHAPDDELRAQLIPSMKHARVIDLLDDVLWYTKLTKRKAIAEYTLLKGVNDSEDHARRTGALLKGRDTYLNVIPYNPVAGAPFERVTLDEARQFVEWVRAGGAFATVRKTMGAEEFAACGQLRAVAGAPRVPRAASV